MTISPRKLKLDCGIFPQMIYVFINKNPVHLNKEIIDYIVDSKIADTSTATDVVKENNFKTAKSIWFDGNNEKLLLYFPNIPTSIHELAIISHELSHITNYVLEIVGIEHTTSDDETFAYLFEYLLKQVYTQLGIDFKFTKISNGE